VRIVVLQGVLEGSRQNVAFVDGKRQSGILYVLIRLAVAGSEPSADTGIVRGSMIRRQGRASTSAAARGATKRGCARRATIESDTENDGCLN